MGSRRILFVDAYDSFSRNIVSLIHQCCAGVLVSTIHIDTNIAEQYGLTTSHFVCSFDAVVLGPGPGDPRNATDTGLFSQMLDTAVQHEIPVRGGCLGFQVLCAHFGHEIVRLPLPCHGQSKIINSDGDDIFETFENHESLRAISYNSLGVHLASFSSSANSTPSPSATSSASTSGSSSPVSREDIRGLQALRSKLKVLAWDDDGFVMAVRHHLLPIWAVQFHPESCGSSHISELIRNWWTQLESIRNAWTSSKLLGFEAKVSQPNYSEVVQQIARVSRTEPDGKVCWSMAQLKSVTPQALSQLCHDASKGRPAAMLESTAKDRYNIYAFPSNHTRVITYVNGSMLTLVDDFVVQSEQISVHEAVMKIEELTKAMPSSGGCPKMPFWGGWIGYMSYEIGLDFLKIKSSATRAVPDFAFLCVERSIVQDVRTHDICVQSIKQDDGLWIEETMHALKKLSNQPHNKTGSQSHGNELADMFGQTEHKLPKHDKYIEQIKTCQNELHAGNSYELCLTAEAQLDFPRLDLDQTYMLYRNLNKHNPVPRAAFLSFPATGSSRKSPTHSLSSLTILSSSPEQFLSCSRNGVLDMMPMKGTVQRTPTTTYADAERILHTPKETAENLMIADLIRHDLYGVGESQQQILCQMRNETVQYDIAKSDSAPTQLDHSSTSSRVGVMALNTIKPFETVYQLVSHITLRPPKELDVNDANALVSYSHAALPYVLPPGSMTGAPKKRSCEILQRLEQRNRGVYSGIIGFMDVGGACSWSVAIRTAFSTGSEDYIVQDRPEAVRDDIEHLRSENRQIWRIGAGGAITVLSDPEAEWEEMMGKLGNVLKAFKYVKEDVQ